MNSFIRTDDHITVVFADGETASMYTSEVNYADLVNAVRAKDWETARELMIPSEVVKKKIEKAMPASTRVELKGGVVYFDGKPMHNTLTERMLSMVQDGFDIQPMARFLENLQDNPSYRAVHELYGFLEKSNLPITEDGHFLAYKRINKEYKDIHSNTMDNSIGAIVTMPRNEVDEDKNRTCSAGLHFCSREYLSSYGTGNQNRTVVLKINPADVVAIPSDYNDAKGRCCRYEVVQELEHSKEREIEGAYDGTEYGEDDDPETIDTAAPETQPTPTTAAPAKQKVAQIDRHSGIVMRVYDSAHDAAMVVDGHAKNAPNIRRVCNGGRNTASGFKWAWVPADHTLPVSDNQRLGDNLLV